MRSKTFCAVLCILLAGLLFQSSDLYAEKKSGGSFGKSSSSRGSPSGSKSTIPPPSDYGNSMTKPDANKVPGYGNTATKPPSGAQAPPGYGNTATPLQSRGAAAGLDQSKSTPLQNQMNRSFSKQESARAYEDYKAQQGRFQMNSNPGNYKPSAREGSTITSIQSRGGYSSGSDYYARRTVFYDAYGWSPPVYIYRSYSSFGIWDAMILWFMLDHINDAQYAAMYYNHQDDPGMQQFKKEAERISAENAELKAKVAKLDESVKSLEQQGVKPDPTYMPSDAAGIALAAGVAGTGVPKSSGFPWTGIIVMVVAVLICMHMLRRRR